MVHSRVFCFGFVAMLLSVQAAQAADPASTTDPQVSTKQKVVGAPKAVAGVLAGLTLGIPIKITRDIKHEIRRYAGTSRGDMGNEFGVVENVYVAATSIPYGLVSGFIMGGIRGTERAITYGARAPFSKESLGLVDPPPPEEKEPPAVVAKPGGIGGLGQ